VRGRDFLFAMLGTLAPAYCAHGHRLGTGQARESSSEIGREYAMPKYFLRLEPSGVEDTAGAELPGPRAAKQLAEAIAEDIAKSWKSHPPQHLVLVKDESGKIICEWPIILH
jgi:hypothetical protein